MIFRGEENYPPNHQSRKYHYSTTEDSSYHPEGSQNKLAELQEELNRERKKRKYIEEQTLRDQMNVLEQLNILEQRFVKVEREKEELQKCVREKDAELEQYKKVKGIGERLKQMMRVVDGKEGDLHEVWRWVKKSIGEYQSIRKKALEWRKVYEEQKKKREVFEMEKTFSSCSQLDSECQ